MAYITVSNSKKIIKELDMNQFLNVTDKLYDRDIYCYSKKEEGSLIAMRELFKDLEKFVSVYYEPIQVKDSFRFIEPESQPCYHHDCTCERLNSDYVKIEIPSMIVERGKDAVIAFRKWYKSENFKKDDIKNYILKLTLKYPELGEINPKSFESKNSGFINYTNYS